MARITLGTPGYIYVLSNASMSHVDSAGQVVNLFKVGQTTLHPYERARQLTGATASPTPFHVVHFRACSDANAAETRCHELLRDYRVNDGREFFAAPLATVIAVVNLVTGANETEKIDLPWSELFATFPDGGIPRELTADERAKCRELATRLENESYEENRRETSGWAA